MSKPATIQLDHWYPHPPAKVWKALTTPEWHAKWWAAGDVKPVVGHRFKLDMGQWGQQPCEVLAVEPEKLFRFRFSVSWTITWKLEAEGEGTRLRLIHDGFDLDRPMDRQAYEGMGQGWPHVLAGMEEALAGLTG
jgi:uncharacterized protein YndB with AHSA1/START domain